MTRAAALFVTLAALTLLACDPPAGGKSTASATPTPIAPSVVPSAGAVAPLPAPSGSTLPVASSRPPLPEPEPAPKRPRELAASPPRPVSTHAGLLGPVDAGKDRAHIERLASAPILQIVRNKGGATITLRARFADGARALIKPDQRHSASNLRAEIAAYHLDRILGFSRTAVVVGRSIGLEHLRQHLLHSDADPEFLARFDREVVAHDGRVSCALIAWHPGRLTSAEPPRDWMKSLRSKEPPPAELLPRLPEWSDMMVFDFLIDNTDRWSGGNVLSLGPGGPLIFLDNAAGFAPGRSARKEMLSAKLAPLCRFRRATVNAVSALGPDSEQRLGAVLGRSLSRDPLAPVLSARQLDALDVRVSELLGHIEGCKAALGDDMLLD